LKCYKEDSASDLLYAMKLCFWNSNLLSRIVTALVSALDPKRTTNSEENAIITLTTTTTAATTTTTTEINYEDAVHMEKLSFVVGGGLPELIDIFKTYSHHGKILTDTCAIISNLVQNEEKLLDKVVKYVGQGLFVKFILAAMKANPERCELHIQASTALGLLSKHPLGKIQLKQENGVDWLLKNILTHPHLHLGGLWDCIKNVYGDLNKNKFYSIEEDDIDEEMGNKTKMKLKKNNNKLMIFLLGAREDWIGRLEVILDTALHRKTREQVILLLRDLLEWSQFEEEIRKKKINGSMIEEESDDIEKGDREEIIIVLDDDGRERINTLIKIALKKEEETKNMEELPFGCVGKKTSVTEEFKKKMLSTRCSSS